MEIDVRTLLLVLGITHLIQIAVFSQQYRTNRAYPGVGWWLSWSAAAFAGFMFMLLRDLPALRSHAIVAQNAMFLLGLIFVYIGVLRFFGRRENRTALLTAFTLYTAAQAFFVYLDDRIVVRGVILSGAIAALAFLTARALAVHSPTAVSSSARFNAAVAIAHGVFFAHRAGSILAGTPPDSVFTPRLFNAAPLLESLAVSLLWTFGFFFMLNQRLHADLAEARDHFEAIFNTSPDAALISRRSDGRIVDVNDGFTAMTGFSRAETVGRSSLELDVWRNPEERARVIDELDRRGQCDNVEAVFVRKDGGEIVGILSAKVVSLRNAPHMISVTRDISGRKRAEQEIRRLNDDLERRVRERTAELEESNKELEAFTYTVSHDLRAPLRAVDGYARILAEDYGACLNAEGRRICAVISESGRTMGSLIDKLLAFSRIGRAEMEWSPVEMAPLARAVFFELTTPAGRERIDFRIGPLPAATGDPALIRQLWANLLANAIRFAAKRARAAIEVGCLPPAGEPLPPSPVATREADPRPAVPQRAETVYYVRDNGAGFDMAYADKLFRVFHSLHSPQEFDSVGVGLAIVQRIVQRHGGRVWADAAPDRGATFFFTLHGERC